MDFGKGFRTIAFNILMATVMLARTLSPESELPDEATVAQTADTVTAGLTLVWGVGNLILRAVTNSPVFKKRSD